MVFFTGKLQAEAVQEAASSIQLERHFGVKPLKNSKNNGVCLILCGKDDCQIRQPNPSVRNLYLQPVNLVTDFGVHPA